MGIILECGDFTGLCDLGCRRRISQTSFVVHASREPKAVKSRRRSRRTFGLAPERVDWRFIDVERSDLDTKKVVGQFRLQKIIATRMSSVRSVSCGRQLDEILYGSTMKLHIDRRFEVIVYDPKSHHLRRLVDSSALTQPIHDWGDDWLIHWTRTCHGRAGETKAHSSSASRKWSVEYCTPRTRLCSHSPGETHQRSERRSVTSARSLHSPICPRCFAGA